MSDIGESGEHEKPATSENETSTREDNPIWCLWPYIRDWLKNFTIRLKQFDGLITALATVFLAFITGLLGLIAYWQYTELHNTDNTLHETMVITNHAWIAPIGVWHDRTKAFVPGEPIDYVFLFKNTGKNPALHFRWVIENDFIPSSKVRDTVTSEFSKEDMCAKVGGEDAGGVIFPDAGTSPYVVSDGYLPPAIPLRSDNLPTGPKIMVSKGMLDGTEVFYVRGCIIYSSVKSIGKSSFCFLVRPYKTEGKPGNFSTTICHYGNDAE